jgi:hypothetical protein
MAEAISVTRTTKKPTKATKHIRKQQARPAEGFRATKDHQKQQKTSFPKLHLAATIQQRQPKPPNIAVVEHKGLPDDWCVLRIVSL